MPTGPGTEIERERLEGPEDALLGAYQVGLGRVPTCVGLPETQRSISINDPKL